MINGTTFKCPPSLILLPAVVLTCSLGTPNGTKREHKKVALHL